ncbi:MAG: hypothetical protein M1840_006842 [Geoglossum simile]|nr:MAG: hypothetical protein M1840_006842 [Geoglossum simile]
MRWDRETFLRWQAIAAEEDGAKRGGRQVKESGIGLYPAFHYWDNPELDVPHGESSIWWRDLVPNFKVLDPFALPQGAHFGVAYTTFCVNPTKYLPYLLQCIETVGGTIRRLAIPTGNGLGAALAILADEVGSEPVYAIVNATGLGAMALCGENTDMYPTKGQTVLVRNEGSAVRIRIAEGYMAYTIPRPGGGGTILGGSKDADNWDPSVDPELSAEIIKRCKELAPDLLNTEGEFDIVSEQVGFRPSRKGGPRISLERVPSLGREKPFIVIHCYGHSGAGYQNSVGSAREVLSLLNNQNAFESQESGRDDGAKGGPKL